jgi:hypothetical protein
MDLVNLISFTQFVGDLLWIRRLHNLSRSAYTKYMYLLFFFRIFSTKSTSKQCLSSGRLAGIQTEVGDLSLFLNK